MAAPMMKLMSCWAFLLLVSSVYSFDDEFEGSRTLTLEHSFDAGPNPVFTKRGVIVIRSVQSNRATFSQVGSLSEEERDSLKELARSDGVYRIRIPIKDSEEEPLYVSSFSKACSVYESSLTDTLVMAVDQSGEVLGVSMVTGGYCTGISVPSSNLTDWNTRVDILVTVTGPVPDTQNYVEKIKKEEQDKDKGGQQDNRSLISKYWMYIVPFVIMMFVMQAMDPQQGGGGGSGGGGGGGR